MAITELLLTNDLGQVGLIMCQVLKNIGATVIGTAGSPEKCDLAKQYGADHCIDYNANKNWVEKVKELTNGEGVDIGMDKPINFPS